MDDDNLLSSTMDDDDLLSSTMDDDDLLSSTMDVIIFEPETGTEFTLEIGYFDSALEIKHKIQEHRNIPVSRQTLTFDGQILLDDNGVIDSLIIENSRISLTIAPDQINLLINLPTSSNMLYSALQIDVNAEIHQLKEKILLMYLGTSNLSIDWIVLQLNGTELVLDEIRLRDYGIRDGMVIDLMVKAGSTINSSPRSSLQNPLINLEDIFSATPQSDQISLLIKYEQYSCLEIDVNAKIHQLKQKILTMDMGMRDLSINQILLRLNGKTELSSDEKTLSDCNIMDQAKIDVTVKSPTISSSSRSSLKRPYAASTPQSVLINLLIKIPEESVQYSCIELNLDDTIHQVKQKILAVDGMMNLTINQIVLVLDDWVFLSRDDKTLLDYCIMDGAKINVWIKSLPNNLSSDSWINSSPEKVRFLVSSRCGTSKMGVEMNELDKVEELRKVLEKQFHFPLPQEGYFFIHKNNVMEDDKSFRLHQVRYGDTIDVYPITSSENPPINLQDIFDAPPVNLEDIFAPSPPPPQSDIQINVLIKLPSKSGLYSCLGIGLNDKIHQLKQKILTLDYRLSSVTINHLVLRLKGTTELLPDEKTLRDCDIMDGAKIDVTIKATPTSSSTGSGSAIINASPTYSSSGSATGINSSQEMGLNKVGFKVVSKCGTRKIEVEMNILDYVGDLREVLEKQNFPVPREDYFFIHKQAVMDEDRSFRWHRVGQGDTIDVFPGCVSKGP